MVKSLSFRFRECFGTFTMLLIEGSSKRGLFRHLSNHVFRSPEVRKIFSQFFLTFSKSRFNLEHFQKKDDRHSRRIFELTDSEKRGEINL